MKLSLPSSVEHSHRSSHIQQADNDDDIEALEDPSVGDETCNGTVASEATGEDEVELIQNLSRKETSSIRFWRFVVSLFIVGAGAAVSTGTFLYISELEQKDARDAFVLFSNTIEDISRFHFKHMFEASRALSREMTAEAVLHDMTFPYISFDNYEVFATQAREAAGLEVISYAPVVQLDQAEQFVNYTVANQNWISDSRRLGMLLDPTLQFDDIDNTEFLPQIYDVNPLAGDTFASVGDGPFAPLWHTSPPPQSLIYFLYNFASDPEYEKIYALQEEYPGKIRKDRLFTRTAASSTLRAFSVSHTPLFSGTRRSVWKHQFFPRHRRGFHSRRIQAPGPSRDASSQSRQNCQLDAATRIPCPTCL